MGFKLINKPLLPNEKTAVVKIGKSQLKKFEKNKPIKVILWNTYKAKKKRFIEDFNELIKNTDLFLLQEYFLNKKVLENHEVNSHLDTVMAVSFFNKANIPTGVSTISTVQNSSHKYIRSDPREPILQTPKMTLITKYPVKFKFKKLCVINVHGINFVNKAKFISHMKQITEYIENDKDPILLAGDFNTWNKHRVKTITEIAEKNGFEEVFFDGDKRRLKLDRIFVKGLKANNQKILDQIDSSDHKPLYFEITI